MANRVLWATGLSAGGKAALGHASLRLADRPDRFLVKGRRYKTDALAAMRLEEMVTCDVEGNLVDGPSGATQCFGLKTHSWMYKLYPDPQADLPGRHGTCRQTFANVSARQDRRHRLGR